MLLYLCFQYDEQLKQTNYETDQRNNF